eukprot:scaffold106548_cov45-Phaeocystis_antarctica.AAC.1
MLLELCTELAQSAHAVMALRTKEEKHDLAKASERRPADERRHAEQSRRGEAEARVAALEDALQLNASQALIVRAQATTVRAQAATARVAALEDELLVAQRTTRTQKEHAAAEAEAAAEAARAHMAAGLSRACAELPAVTSGATAEADLERQRADAAERAKGVLEAKLAAAHQELAGCQEE